MFSINGLKDPSHKNIHFHLRRPGARYPILWSIQVGTKKQLISEIFTIVIFFLSLEIRRYGKKTSEVYSRKRTYKRIAILTARWFINYEGMFLFLFITKSNFTSKRGATEVEIIDMLWIFQHESHQAVYHDLQRKLLIHLKYIFALTMETQPWPMVLILETISLLLA